MEAAPAEQKTAYEAPKSLHGFELVRDQFVAEYDSQVLTYRHNKTGKAPMPREYALAVVSSCKSADSVEFAPLRKIPQQCSSFDECRHPARSYMLSCGAS